MRVTLRYRMLQQNDRNLCFDQKIKLRLKRTKNNTLVKI